MSTSKLSGETFRNARSWVNCSLTTSRAPVSGSRSGRDADRDAAVPHPRRVRGNPHGRVVQALARRKVEALLEDRRRDLGNARAITDDAARDHECVAEWIVVADREDLLGPVADADD